MEHRARKITANNHTEVGYSHPGHGRQRLHLEIAVVESLPGCDTPLGVKCEQSLQEVQRCVAIPSQQQQ